MPTLLPGTPGPDGAPAMLGVMGGGQLARMFVHAAQAMGYRTAVLDPDPDSPAGRVSHLHVRSDFDDEAGLAQLAAACVAVSTEFENVPAPSLAWLAVRRPVAPGAAAVAICQQRDAEKAHFQRCGVPCALHEVIKSEADLARVDAALFPALLKTARLGYDGKGQVGVATADALPAAWRALGGVSCVLEKRLPLAQEISVIVARAADGRCVHLPVQQNLHRDGILAVTQVPAPDVTPALADEAVACAGRLAASMDYVGVLCVEFFVLADGSLVANEMAPRPHNSGHYSIDACDLSQFELQVRCMAGLPLVQPRQHSAAVMLNLLGDLWFTADGARLPPWDRVLALPGVHLHLYGKTEARRGRKMGHLSVTAADAPAARRVALQAAACLDLPPVLIDAMPLLDVADALALRTAAEALAAGELLAFPTETVYGLGARADDDAAVARIYAAKGRPASHPLIVHAADAVQAQSFAADWPKSARLLAEAFWPGPLTLIVPRAPALAQAAAGGQSSIGLRVPAHPVAQALLREALALGVPGVAAPSANRFGRVSATTAAHVVQEFGPDLKVLDGGDCPGGIESAIVDCRARRPSLLRPGLLSRARIEAVLGEPLAGRDDDSPRASGSLRSHYAPAARLRLMNAQQLRDALDLLGAPARQLKLGVYSRARLRPGRGVEWRAMPDEPAAAAHELFATLRVFDALGVQLIWVEQPPDTADWEGVRDRLSRAAANVEQSSPSIPE